MNNQHPIIREIEKDTALDRRSFVTTAGKGLLAATIIGSITAGSASAQKVRKPATKGGRPRETDPVKFSSIKDPSEKQDAPPASPMRPSGRIGYAIVGLGRLSLNQILPALAKCK